jgi:hypothetical protein
MRGSEQTDVIERALAKVVEQLNVDELLGTDIPHSVG